MELLKVESYKSGLIISTIFNLVAKVLLFGQSIFIAYYFPVTETDIFFFCYATLIVFAWFINSIDYSIVIPQSMQIRISYGSVKAIKYVNVFLLINLSIGTIVTLAFISFPIELMSFFSGFNLEQLVRNQTLLHWLSPLLGMIIFSTTLNNILVSYKYFTMPSLTSAMTSILAILFMIMFHKELGVISIVLGMNIAYLLNIVFLIVFIKNRLKWELSISARMSRLINWRSVTFVQLGNFMSFMATYFPYYMLSSFSQGVITALNYGQKTADMPNHLIITQVSSISGIKLNELHAEKNLFEVERIFISSISLLLFVTIPICFLVSIYAEQIISLLYSRGMFQAALLDESVQYFRILIWLLPLVSINTICSRLFMAANKVKEASYYQFFLNLFLILATFICVTYFGSFGYPLALLGVYFINAFSINLLISRYFLYIKFFKIYSLFCKFILLNLPIFIIISFLAQLIVINPLLEMGLLTLIYMVGLLILNHYLKLNNDIVQLIGFFKSWIADYLK